MKNAKRALFAFDLDFFPQARGSLGSLARVFEIKATGKFGL